MQRNPTVSPFQNLFVTGGKMGELISDYAWSHSKLGDMETWPQSLQSALSICLNSNFPIAVYWGPDLVLLYNDAWSPIPGNKHPWALGKRAVEVWPEIWDAIEPQFQKAFSGVPGGSKDALLPMQRHGYTEECYFDFTFTPVYGESGNVEGIFNAVIETTYRVINERRAAVLQRLSDAINSITSPAEVYSKAAYVLNESQADVSFFCIAEFDDSDKIVVKSCSEEFNNPEAWPLGDIQDSTIRHIEEVDKLGLKLPARYWPESPKEAVIVPLKANDGHVFGVLIAGLSARRKFDKDYKSFFESLSTIISGELNTIKALDEQRKKAESLAEIDRAKTAFFSNISHELRTPLTLMLSPLEEVLESSTSLNESERVSLMTSHRNTLRLQKLVNTLLDFSRIEAGRFNVNKQSVNISRLTNDLSSSFRSAIEKAGIKYTVETNPSSAEVAMDVDIWEKIVLNIISNAFKYTQEGEIEVKLEMSSSNLVFSVKDSGIGISEDDQQLIFERFHRVSNVQGRSQEGTGIGLSMVKELVSLLGGQINVKSKPGKGSVFSVIVPLSDLSSPVSQASPNVSSLIRNDNLKKAFANEAASWVGMSSDGKAFDTNAKKGTVLISDDNTDMREYIQRLLADEYVVHVTANGEDAYHIAKEVLPDIIITDIMMPKLDGFGLLRELKTNLATRNIPVIFLSARAGEEAKIEGIAAGADDYLVKPFAAKELVARVNNQVAISKVRRETEKEFFNLFLQSPAHIHVFQGPEHVVEFFHPLGIQIIGRDITGMKIRDALPEVAGQGYFEMLDQVYNEGKTFYLPETKGLIRDKHGVLKEYYFNITYLPWRDADQRIKGVLQFTFDVTEQAKAHQKVKESEERFRILSKTIPQIVWIADKNGDIEYLSDQWYDYTSASVEVGRQSFSSFIHKEDVDEVRRKWKESREQRIAWKAEFRLRNERTGEYKWFFGQTTPLLDDNGEVNKWIGSASDIHPQKTLNEHLEHLVAERTEELVKLNNILKEKNEDLSAAQIFLQTVLDSSVELVTAFDPNLNFTFVNRRAKVLENRDPEQLIGRNLLDIDPGFKNTEGYQHLLRALKGETIHVESRRPFINETRVFETFVIPLKRNEVVTGVVTMQRDITAMVRLSENLKSSNEQLKRSNEDLQQFAHVTSHDLKEPVRKIKMYGDILKNDYATYLPEKGKDYLNKIERSTNRISVMIDGVLQYSSVEGAVDVFEPVDLNAVIKTIKEDLEIAINDAKATLKSDELPKINGSSTLIYQLFYNLINNSLKFRRKDVDPLITVSKEFVVRDNENNVKQQYLRVDIADNGIGFDQAFAEKIFESFARLHPKDMFEGTGLGLALCKKIAFRHGGFITAQSDQRSGATFSIFFPRARLMEQ